MSKAKKSTQAAKPKPTLSKPKKPLSPGDPRTTVFIIDDDEGMRESLAFLVESVGLHAEAFDSAEAFLEHHDPAMRGCILLDVRMPGMGGIELQQRLHADHAHPPVILLTAHGDVQMAVRAMRAGAFDFIEKPCNDQDLIDRIHKAIRHDAKSRLDRTAAREIERRVSELSPREREVMELVIDGMLNKQIAAALDISIKTVEVHRSRVMEKMQADGLAELVRMVVRAGVD